MTHKVTLDYWPGLYREGWGRDIVPEAYAHPAKYARALIRKIYAHAVDLGWLEPGDVVLDPFGGVALGGLDASYHGAHWVGVELERHFVDTGAGCDCTGIGKADWVRFYGRWERARTLEGRHWCPRCLAQAKQIAEPDPQLALFDREPSAAYVRSSGRIPETLPHHYTGNAEHWRRFGFAGSVTLLQGDSRRLLAVVQEAGLAVSSPPYSRRTVHGQAGIDLDKMNGNMPGGGSQVFTSDRYGYGQELGNLGNMPDGDHGATLAVSSPPYIDRSIAPTCIQGYEAGTLTMNEGDTYSAAPGQLGAMPEGDHGASLAVSSPPYADGCRQQGTDRHPERLEGTAFAPARYDLAVSSPPFGETQSGGGLSLPEARYKDGTRIGCNCGFQNQGATPGNLASMSVSSPPYVQALGKVAETADPQKAGADCQRGILTDRGLGQRYGTSPGQLGTMPEGEPGASLTVSSPPYEASLTPGSGEHLDTLPQGFNPKQLSRADREGWRYNFTNDNLGNEKGDTFWTAARAILEQVYQALRPGGHAIWVVKAFVRDGAVVDFPGQWRALCEAVGFVTLHEHRALLVEEHGAQLDLEGNHVKRQVARKSFFRRIYEQKYPANRIDFEVVYCMEKPG